LKKASPHRNFAAADLGTNSFHLIIVRLDPQDGTYRILDREKEVVRLGSGVNDLKYLSAQAMNRALATAKRFKGIADAHNAPLRAIATSAIREAVNQDEFIRRARAEAGIAVEVISGFEEARLIYLGVLQALPVYARKILLLDIGGGSTEFLIGKKGKILYSNSLKLGAIRLTQRFFQSDKLDAKDIRKCREFIGGMLSPIVRSVRKQSFDVAVGSSGTVLNLANIIRIRNGSNVVGKLNNFCFDRGDLQEVVKLLLSKRTASERSEIIGLDQKRADIIVAGALILEESMQQLKIRELTVSEFALREGIIWDAIEKDIHPRKKGAFYNVRDRSVLQLAQTFHYEKVHSHHVARLALSMFDQLKDHHGLGDAEREYLQAAAILHEIGLFVSHAQHHMHSYYLIRNSELLGFTDREQEIIANIARYHRKSFPKQRHEGFGKLLPEDQSVVQKLSAILRIADGLDRTHKNSVKNVACTRRRHSLKIALSAARRSSLDLELWGAERKKDLFEQMFDMRVRFVRKS